LLSQGKDKHGREYNGKQTNKKQKTLYIKPDRSEVDSFSYKGDYFTKMKSLV